MPRKYWLKDMLDFPHPIRYQIIRFLLGNDGVGFLAVAQQLWNYQFIIKTKIVIIVGSKFIKYFVIKDNKGF